VLSVTSRQVVWLFLEQLRFEFVPVFHGLQGRLAAQGSGYAGSAWGLWPVAAQGSGYAGSAWGLWPGQEGPFLEAALSRLSI